MENEILRIERGKGECLLVAISEFKGKKNLNIRIWYTDKEGNLKPTQKGVTISPEDFEAFKEAINSAGSLF
ncbi:MAG: transcriptional coactivator p15/PC4 family protein [Leptospiraceae bacterium]|nr:transcriptional coactivator p15/PC4 family protein [Leptospiraceae bacterium]MCP5512819.1 transcriptional coactivator p15/PC4 family protein [Leptospiraceae bacterium]